MSVDPRSCRLIGFFAPVVEKVGVLFALGEADKLSFRLVPDHSGAPVGWFRDLWNMDKDANVITLNEEGTLWSNNQIETGS